MFRAAAFSRSVLPMLLLGVLVGLGAGWAAAGQPANAEGGVEDEAPAGERAPNQTFYLRAAGLSFRPRDSRTTFASVSPGCIYRMDSAGQENFVYDLQLPQGAIIDYLSLYYYDVAAGQDLTVDILAHDGAGGETTVESLSSTGSGGFGATGSGIFSHVVDNYNESLVVQATIPAGQSLYLQLCGIRVRYQFDIATNYLPAMLKMATP